MKNDERVELEHRLWMLETAARDVAEFVGAARHLSPSDMGAVSDAINANGKHLASVLDAMKAAISPHLAAAE